MFKDHLHDSLAGEDQANISDSKLQAEHEHQTTAHQILKTSEYRPESPFLPEPEYSEVSREALMSSYETEAGTAFVESPFLSEYYHSEGPVESMEAAEFREILDEIHDEEFVEAVQDLVSELQSLAEDRFSGETVEPMAEAMEAERFLENYVAPLRTEIENFFDRAAGESELLEGETVSEPEIEAFFEQFESGIEFESPAFDNFFKKLKKLAKKAIKKVKKIGKKVIKIAKKFSPIHIILGKLKKLARPLLNRVLKFAINKLPASIRPLARRLAKRFLGEVAENMVPQQQVYLEDAFVRGDEAAEDDEAASLSAETLAVEFETMVARYMIEGEAFEDDPVYVQYVSGEAYENAEASFNLDWARENFIRDIMALEEGEDPTPVIERFVPAILAALRVGIRLIGRKRVVNFIAKLVAKLIGRFVGKQSAVPLSRALVDAGLKLVSLETPENEEEAAGAVLAATVEETVERLVSEAPAEAFEDEVVLEGFLQQAMEESVTSNFPPALLQPELREAPVSKGTWVLQPLGSRKKRYKKYTKQIEVTITPKMAKSIVSFGGQTLYSFMKEQLGLPIDKAPAKAKMHLYEAIRGTWLSYISKLDRNTPGLGSARRAAWMQIHPLTCEAASTLIPQEVGLCRKVSSRFLVNRNRIAVRQRFYYLEISGARVISITPPTVLKPGGKLRPGPVIKVPVRASEVNVTLDFRRRQISIFNFLSEAASQEIVTKLRGGSAVSAVSAALTQSIKGSLNSVLSGKATNHIRIIREVPEEEGFAAALGPVLRFVGEQLAALLVQYIFKQLLKSLKGNLQGFANEFTKAKENPADGVTVTFALSQVDAVFALFKGNPLARSMALAKLIKGGISGVFSLTIHPGFHRE